MRVVGDLIACLCDTPAAAVMGGFKETALARKFCRKCNASNESFSKSFTHQGFTNRNMAEYIEQCEILESTAVGRNRGHWSKLFGVNSRSVLTQIPNFDVTLNLLQDPMHILLEGVYSNVCALFINTLISEKLITIDNLNTWTSTFQFSHQDKGSRPYLFDKAHLSNNCVLKQKAATILLLVHILPLFFGRHVPLDGKYCHFLRLTQIVQLSFAYRTDRTTAGTLHAEIECFLRDFKTYYPQENIKPKMHFMTHLPQQIIEFGPLKQHSTMRFEGKHAFFKGQKLTNFKNLPKTLSMRHQLWTAYEMSTCTGEFTGKYFDRGIDRTEGEIISAQSAPFVVQQVFDKEGVTDSDWYRAGKAVKCGFTYTSGTILLLAESAEEMPCFAEVCDVFCFRCEKVIFTVEKLTTVGWRPEFNSYHVEGSNTLETVDLDMLKEPWPLPAYMVNGKKLVVNRFSLYINTPPHLK